MTPPDRRQFLSTAALAALPPFLRAADPPKGRVNGQPQAAAAGMEVLAAGGNAVDAVVAAALVAGVVAVPSTGIGGYGGAPVVRRADRKGQALRLHSDAPG